MGGLSRNTKLFSIASFLVDLSSEMIFPLLPFFLTQILAAPVFVIGLIEGLADFTKNGTSVLSGLYSDRIGKRKIIILVGYGLSGLLKGFFVIVTTWPQAFIVRIIERFGKGLRDTPRDALIVLSESKENLGKAFGFRKMMDNFGAILGPLAGSMLLVFLLPGGVEYAYRAIFGIALIPAVLSVFVLTFIHDKQTAPQKSRKIFGDLLTAKNYRAFIAIGALFALGQFSIALFLLKAGAHIPVLFIPIAYLCYNVFYTVFALPAGWLADVAGPKISLMLAQLLFFLVILGFIFSVDSILMFVLFALLGVFMAVKETAPSVFITKMVAKEHYGSAVGSYNGIVGLTALPANLIAGMLWDVQLFSMPASFVFSAITTALSIILIWLLVKE